MGKVEGKGEEMVEGMVEEWARGDEVGNMPHNGGQCCFP